MNASVKIISKILFYLCRLLAIIYLAITAYAAISLLTGQWLRLQDEGKKFVIDLPFTQQPFLVGDYTKTYIIFDFLMILGFYGLFFWMAANVFKLFHQPRLFTAKGVTQLRNFYLLNLIVPALSLLLASIFAYVEEGVEMLVVIHIILGVFIYFLAAIFKQGLNLQDQQDLFI